MSSGCRSRSRARGSRRARRWIVTSAMLTSTATRSRFVIFNRLMPSTSGFRPPEAGGTGGGRGTAFQSPGCPPGVLARSRSFRCRPGSRGPTAWPRRHHAQLQPNLAAPAPSQLPSESRELCTTLRSVRTPHDRGPRRTLTVEALAEVLIACGAAKDPPRRVRAASSITST